MKFKLNNRTGHMEPTKNDVIYFAQTVGGGLRVSDKKNNKKYILEKNGDVTFLAGQNKDLNIYDRYDANMIAERVKRMFGGNHPYSNVKKFLRGCHIVESFQEFHKINEGMWKSGIERASSGQVRKEQGIKVKLPNGSSVILDDKGVGIPQTFENGEFFADCGDLGYLFKYADDDTYSYFIYQEAEEYGVEETGCYLIAQSNGFDMEDDDFLYIRGMLNSNFVILIDIIGDETPMKFTVNSNHTYCECGGDNYYLFDSEEAARDYAYNYTYDLIEDMDIDKTLLDRWMSYMGTSFFNMRALEEVMDESHRSYVEDIEDEDGDMGNRLFDELAQRDLIEDTDEYFETDEDGELDYDQPKFDVDSKKEEYVEEMNSDYDDAVDYYIQNFGTDGLENYIDKDELVEEIIKSDGIAMSMGCDDDYTYTTDTEEVWIYKE